MSKDKSIRRDIRFRVYLAFTGICLFGAAIIIKAAMIQVKEGDGLRKRSSEMKSRFRIDTLYAERGNIYNEDGVLLMSSTPEFEVAVDFSVINTDTFTKYLDTLSEGVAIVLGNTPEFYKRDFTKAFDNESQYHVLGRKLTYSQYEQLRVLPVFNKGKGVGGFIANRTEKRSAPYKNLASYTLGIYRNEKSTGLERSFNTMLSGKNGYRESRRSTGVWVPVEGSEVSAKNGKDIVTTLDMNIQAVAENALLDALQHDDCQYGTCIVMEVKTGKVRALANLGKVDSMHGAAVDDIYTEGYNYALVPTEPGSTFKLVTLLSLFQDRYVTADDIVDAFGGEVQLGGKRLRDSHLGLGKMPVWMAFAKSSNAAIGKMASRYYSAHPQKFVKHLFDLQLDKPTGIELKGDWRTTVKKVDANWSATSLPWMAIGYEVAISPMHTCMLYNAVANNGRMMRPYLVSSVREYGKEIQHFDPKVVVDKIADSFTISQLKRCLRSVITDGTAKGIESPYYTMAGKTGTAQVADKKIKYADGVYQGSFVGYFPAEDPKYTVCVVIRTKPHSNNYYGGVIAAPVFKMVADKIFSDNMGAWDRPLDSLAKHNTGRLKAHWATAANYSTLLSTLKKQARQDSVDEDALMQLGVDSNRKWTLKPVKLYRNIMPDVRGMGLRDAVYMLENCGLNVVVKGKGRVVSQSLEQGTRIKKDQTVTLQLN